MEALQRLGRQCVTRMKESEGARTVATMTVEGRGGGGRLPLLSPGEESGKERLQRGRGKKTFKVSKDSKSTRESREGGTWGEGDGE